MSDVRSRWWPDVREAEGRRKAAQAGFIACVAMTILTAIGLVVLAVLHRSPADGSAAGGADIWGEVGILLELAVFVTAGLRLRRGKGLIWGAVALVLFLLEVVVKLASGTGITFAILYAAIVLSLVNGLRGAWAERVSPIAERDTFA